MEKVKSEKGFTLLELIFVVTITGILSSTLILPFASSIKQGTQPEIYNTATYLAMAEIEKKRSEGYTYTMNNNIGTSTSSVTKVYSQDTGAFRTYTVQIIAGYVTHSGSSFSDPPVSSPSSEFIKVTVTISNPDIPNNVVLWTILDKDFYDPDANS